MKEAGALFGLLTYGGCILLLLITMCRAAAEADRLREGVRD